MNKKKIDNIISVAAKIVLFIVFVTAAVLVIMSASGYRLRFETKEVVQTGMIAVKSIPRNASLKLDGVKQNGSSTWRLAGLEPGVYKINLSKNEYYSWNQTANIEAGETALYEDVLLFYNKPEIIDLNEETETNLSSRLISSTSDEDLLLKSDNHELWYAGALITRLSTEIHNPQLYTDGAHFSYISDGKFHILDFDGTNDLALFDIKNDANYTFLGNGNKVLFESEKGLKTAQIR